MENQLETGNGTPFCCLTSQTSHLDDYLTAQPVCLVLPCQLCQWPKQKYWQLKWANLLTQPACHVGPTVLFLLFRLWILPRAICFFRYLWLTFLIIFEVNLSKPPSELKTPKLPEELELEFNTGQVNLLWQRPGTYP